MSTMELVGWTLVALAGVAGSALCSGLETAVYCLNRVKLYIRSQKRPPDYSATLLKHELDHPERWLAANLVTNAAFAYLGASGITELLYGLGYSDTGAIIINVLVLTPAFFIFVESLPKEVFRAEADRFAYVFAPWIAGTRLLLTWCGVLPLVRWCADLAARLIGGEGEAGLAQSARDRVAAMLKESQEHGVLSASQAALVDRALIFARLRIGDEMVPWSRVVSIDREWDRVRALRAIGRTPHTWFPVVDGRSGRVLGAVRLMDLHLKDPASMGDIMFEPARLSPDHGLGDATIRLREAAAPLGIVEQQGRPVGLVTTKDLIEPLTGELVDW